MIMPNDSAPPAISAQCYFVPGKLYRVQRHFWLLFPTKEPAAAVTACAAVAAAAARAAHAAARAAAWASYWSKELDCNVSFISEGDVVMIVEISSGIQVKVINQEGLSGWINFPSDESWTKGTITEVSSK